MGSDWRFSTWGDEISLEYGKSLKGYRESNGPFRVFGSNGAVGWTDRILAKGPGVILGRKGAYRGVRYSPDPFFVIDTAYYVKPRTNLDMRWLYFAIIHHKLGEIDDGSPIPSTTRAAVYVADVEIPPLHEQKAIAHILGSLDDKIELNRRMNATLEGMAQALFKSWFVDYDPVIDNALAAGNPIPEELTERAEVRHQALTDGTANREAAKQFPTAFHFAEEIGWIPEGWEAGSIGNIAKAIGGFAFKSQAFQESGFPVIKIKNIVGDGTVSIEGAQCIGTEDAKKALKFTLNDGDLLMAMTGATVGKIGLVVNGGKSAFLNQRVAKLVGRSIENFSSFLFCFFKNQANFKQIVGTAGGSAQPNISSSGIENVQCVIPNNDLLVRFAELVDPNFEKWISNYKLSKSLSNLRDTLLPKLISGELRIPDADKLTEEALV